MRAGSSPQNPAQLSLAFGVYDATPRGDGSYVLTPSFKPSAEISVAQAARFLNICRQSVYRLIDEGKIKACKPTPRKINVYFDSVVAHKKRSDDLEQWDREKVRKSSFYFKN